jgi:hypothetical protein
LKDSAFPNVLPLGVCRLLSRYCGAFSSPAFRKVVQGHSEQRGREGEAGLVLMRCFKKVMMRNARCSLKIIAWPESAYGGTGGILSDQLGGFALNSD